MKQLPYTLLPAGALLAGLFLLLPGLRAQPVSPATPDQMLVEAMHKKSAGELGQAAVLLTECLKINPRLAPAYYELSEIYLLADDLPNMLTNARLAVRYSEEPNRWYELHLAKAYRMNEIPDSALLVYHKLLASRPDALLFRELARLYSETGSPRKALGILENNQDLFGSETERNLERYQILYENKKWRKAADVLRTIIAENPSVPQYHSWMGALYQNMNRRREAVRSYKKRVELTPSETEGHLTLISFLITAGRTSDALNEAEVMMRSDSVDLEQKIDLFLSLGEDSITFRNHIQRFNQLAELLFTMAPDNQRVRFIHVDKSVRVKDYTSAINDLQFIIASNRYQLRLWEQLFFILDQSENFDELFKVTEEAKKLFPDQFLPHFFNGLSAVRTSKYPEALAALKIAEKYMDQYPGTYTDILVLQGEAYHETARYALADSVFEKALTVDGTVRVLLNNYSYYLALRGERLQQAEELINRCLESNPDNPTFLDTRGWVLYRQGRIPEARKILQKALRLDKYANEEILSHYVQVLLSLGEKSRAMKHLTSWLDATENKMAPEQKLQQIMEKWGE
jgi:tetratricopeptide (TPR) repeat protein